MVVISSSCQIFTCQMLTVYFLFARCSLSPTSCSLFTFYHQQLLPWDYCSVPTTRCSLLSSSFQMFIVQFIISCVHWSFNPTMRSMFSHHFVPPANSLVPPANCSVPVPVHCSVPSASCSVLCSCSQVLTVLFKVQFLQYSLFSSPSRCSKFSSFSTQCSFPLAWRSLFSSFCQMLTVQFLLPCVHCSLPLVGDHFILSGVHCSVQPARCSKLSSFSIHCSVPPAWRSSARCSLFCSFYHMFSVLFHLVGDQFILPGVQCSVQPTRC